MHLITWKRTQNKNNQKVILSNKEFEIYRENLRPPRNVNDVNHTNSLTFIYTLLNHFILGNNNKGNARNMIV